MFGLYPDTPLLAVGIYISRIALLKGLDADVLKLQQSKYIRRRGGADAVVTSLEHCQSLMENMQRSSSAAYLAMFIHQHKVDKDVRRELINPTRHPMFLSLQMPERKANVAAVLRYKQGNE